MMGPDISIWQFPLSLLLSLAFLTGLFLLAVFLPECRVRRFLSGRWLCIVSISTVTVMTAVEGTWGIPMHCSPVFWVFAALMMVSLGFTVTEEIRRHRSISSISSHMGMFLLVFGALWGAPDTVKAMIPVSKDKVEETALSRNGKIVHLPFSLKLDDFTIDYYEDGTSPKQYRSRIEADGNLLETSVNHPCHYKGYAIYQSDYDHENGEFSILSLVRDPWLPVVFTGILLLAAGALLELAHEWKSRVFLPAVIIVSILFSVISVARINFGTLMPALRSWWFVPHLVMYMLAYSSLALALIASILSVCGVRPDRMHTSAMKLFRTSSALLLLGMSCGAVWAKAAWGDWWTWDAKECWAAVTWMLTLAGIHLPAHALRKRFVILACIIISFLSIQVTWYGVDSLPASRTSLHTYK